MGIQGFSSYDAFQSNYRINDIPRVDIDKASKVPQMQQNEQLSQNQSPDISVDAAKDNRPRSIDPNEVSIGFNKNDDFSYIGRDKDVTTNDIQKAISDMKQDSILQEYQYFVGSAKNIYQSPDGMVLQKF